MHGLQGQGRMPMLRRTNLAVIINTLFAPFKLSFFYNI